MAFSSFVYLVFGVSVVPSVRILVSSPRRGDVRYLMGLILGFRLLLVLIFVLLFFLYCFYSWIFLNGLNNFTYYFLILVISLLQSVFQVGDVFKLAKGQDQISSSYQGVANLGMIFWVLFWPPKDIWFATVIYYIPTLLSNFFIYIDDQIRERFIVLPIFRLLRMWRIVVESLAYVFNSLSDYFRLYIPGIIFLAAGYVAEQVYYSTVILFVARLINPISLVLRPLIPIYLDAIKRRDVAWLRRLRVVIFWLPLAMSFLLLLVFVFSKFWSSGILDLLNIGISNIDWLFVFSYLLCNVFYIVISSLFHADHIDSLRFSLLNFLYMVLIFFVFYIFLMIFHVNTANIILLASVLLPGIVLWRHLILTFKENMS
ncbi:hypothetical protein [Curvibacter gracilis]|uniref:hypothetical protein n=1 Tax=Curvibacter gracilis TaxID=230310 RepID=UPI0012F85E8B|nr:hypothetical protein [Curvibacter gracilis]